MTWKGASCYCPEGKQAVGERCVDANECAEDDTCDQSCTNLPGTYKCGCMPGSYFHFQLSFILGLTKKFDLKGTCTSFELEHMSYTSFELEHVGYN